MTLENYHHYEFINPLTPEDPERSVCYFIHSWREDGLYYEERTEAMPKSSMQFFLDKILPSLDLSAEAKQGILECAKKYKQLGCW